MVEKEVIYLLSYVRYKHKWKDYCMIVMRYVSMTGWSEIEEGEVEGVGTDGGVSRGTRTVVENVFVAEFEGVEEDNLHGLTGNSVPGMEFDETVAFVPFVLVDRVVLSKLITG